MGEPMIEWTKGKGSGWSSGVTKVWLDDRVIYDETFSGGAWPKALTEPPVGWDERDSLV